MTPEPMELKIVRLFKEVSQCLQAQRLSLDILQAQVSLLKRRVDWAMGEGEIVELDASQRPKEVH